MCEIYRKRSLAMYRRIFRRIARLTLVATGSVVAGLSARSAKAGISDTVSPLRGVQISSPLTQSLRGMSSSPSSLTRGIAWQHGYRSAFHQAIDQHKPLVLVFVDERVGQPNSYQCRQFDILNSPQVSRLADLAIFAEVRVDQDADGRRATETLKIEKLPAISVMAPDNGGVSETERWEGQYEADDLLPALHAAIMAAVPHAPQTIAEAVAQWQEAASFGDARSIDELLPEPYASVQRAGNKIFGEIDDAHHELMSAMNVRLGPATASEVFGGAIFGSTQATSAFNTLSGHDRRDELKSMTSVRLLSCQRSTEDAGAYDLSLEIRRDGGSEPMVMTMRASRDDNGWTLISPMMIESYNLRSAADAEQFQQEHLAGARALLAAYRRCTSDVKAGRYASRQQVNAVMLEAYAQNVEGFDGEMAAARR
jgi:hypothetical protein